MKTNQDYKNAALDALRGNWAKAVVAAIIFCLIAGVCVAPGQFQTAKGQSSSGLLMILVYYPLSVGFVNAFRLLFETDDDRLTENTFSIGFKNWLHNVWGMFLMGIFISLWTLLFIVPGLVKAYSYAMTPYILAEHPELSANQAIEKSMAMMDGHKFDLFYLHLSFIGWSILCIVTLGIGFLWLSPYFSASQAAFYKNLKDEAGVEVERVL